MTYDDDPRNDPNRVRPYAGIGKVLGWLTTVFVSYILLVNVLNGTVRDTAGTAVNSLNIGQKVEQAIKKVENFFTGHNPEHPFGRDYPKGSRKVEPRFNVTIEDFGTRKANTWVTSRRDGRRTTEYRYWGWHNRPGSLFTIAINYNARGWKQKPLARTMSRTNALGKKVHINQDPWTVRTNLGDVEFLNFSIHSTRGKKNCTGFQKYGNDHRAQLRGAACAVRGQMVDPDALACIIGQASHPQLSAIDIVHTTPCPALFISSRDNS